MTNFLTMPIGRVNCLMLFNEIWALKLRLGYEYDLFDSFVIVESTKTFAGREKLLYFREYAGEFAEFRDKIVYVEVDDLPKVRNETYIHTEDRVAPENRWPLERFSRNAFKRGLGTLNLAENSLIIVQDMDEITSKESVEMADRELKRSELMRFYLANYRHTVQASAKMEAPFQGGYAIRGILLGYDLHYLRWAYRSKGVPINKKLFGLALQDHEQLSISEAIPDDLRVIDVPHAGWHFSHMSGGCHNLLRFKVDNFAHSESSAGKEPVDSTIDYYQVLCAHIEKNAHKYNYQDIDPDLPDFVKGNITKFPILLRPQK